jgi:hypothetical protein
MLKGIVSTNGLNGLREKFCSSNILKKKENKEGAYSPFVMSICAGVIKVAKDSKKISE